MEQPLVGSENGIWLGARNRKIVPSSHASWAATTRFRFFFVSVLLSASALGACGRQSSTGAAPLDASALPDTPAAPDGPEGKQRDEGTDIRAIDGSPDTGANSLDASVRDDSLSSADGPLDQQQRDQGTHNTDVQPVTGIQQCVRIGDGTPTVFVFSADARTVFVGTSIGTVLAYNVETGVLRETLGPFGDKVKALTAPPDGSRLILQVDDQILSLSLATGKTTTQLALDSPDTVVFSADGTCVAVPYLSPSAVRVFSVVDGTIIATLSVPNSPYSDGFGVRQVSADGSLLLIVSRECFTDAGPCQVTASIYSANDGSTRQTKQSVPGALPPGSGSTLSPDGRYAYLIDTIYRLVDSTEIQKITCQEAAFSADGSLFACGDASHRYGIYTLDGSQLTLLFQTSQFLAFDQKGLSLLALDNSGASTGLSVVSTIDGAPISNMELGSVENTTWLRLVGEGPLQGLFRYSGTTLDRWAMPALTAKSSWSIPRPGDWPLQHQFFLSGDGLYYATFDYSSSSQGTATVLSLPDQRVVATVATNGLWDFSPDGRLLLIQDTYDGPPQLWNVELGQAGVSLEETQSSNPLNPPAYSFRFLPDSKRIASVLMDESALGVWDANTGARTSTIPLGGLLPSAYLAMDFSPDGRYAVIGSANWPEDYLLDLVSETVAGRLPHAAVGAFSSDSNLWAFWNYAESRLIVVQLPDGIELATALLSDFTSGIAFLSDGRTLVVGGTGCLDILCLQ